MDICVYTNRNVDILCTSWFILCRQNASLILIISPLLDNATRRTGYIGISSLWNIKKRLICKWDCSTSLTQRGCGTTYVHTYVHGLTGRLATRPTLPLVLAFSLLASINIKDQKMPFLRWLYHNLVSTVYIQIERPISYQNLHGIWQLFGRSIWLYIIRANKFSHIILVIYDA